jgi:hypothetical protein
VDDAGWAALPALPALRQLGVYGNRLTNVVAALAILQLRCPGLHELCAADNPWTSGLRCGAPPAAWGDALPALVWLDDTYVDRRTNPRGAMRHSDHDQDDGSSSDATDAFPKRRREESSAPPAVE